MLSAKTAIRAAVIGVGAVVVASCGGDDSVAATVNGTDIATEDVESQAELIGQNPAVQQQFQGIDEERLDQQLQVDALNQYIFEIVLRDGAEELGVDVTEEDIEKSRAEIAAQFGGEDAFYTQLEQQGLDREEVDRQLEVVALQEAMITELGPGVSDEEVQEAYDAGAPARHILVADEAEADQVVERIENGEDFAKVAEETSTDGTAQQGGDLGFVQPGATVPAFEDALFGAEEGELVGPVESQFGFHVIQRLEKPAFEDVEEEIRTQLERQKRQEGEAAFQEFIAKQMREAEVEVDSRYGEWDAEAGRVIPDDPIQPEQPQQPPPENPEDSEQPEDGGGSEGGDSEDGGSEDGGGSEGGTE